VSEALAYLTVLVAAAIPWLEVLLVVPAGIVAGLPPAPVAVVAALGNVATLVPLVLAGDRIRSWLRRRRTDGRQDAPAPDGTSTDRDRLDRRHRSGRGERALRVFDRFGLIGLAALGPLLTGIHVAALVALAAGAPRRPTVLWLSGGVVVWSALAAVATVLGLETFVDPDRLPDLGLR
jgi:uncharacterized membrane protein